MQKQQPKAANKLKNLTQAIFNYFTKNKKQEEMEKQTPVEFNCYGQPHVLQQRMREERLTHGQRVTADIGPVRLESNHGRMYMYFCPLQCIEVKETISRGDMGALPQEAIIEGFSVPQGTPSGLYTIKDVTLDSNGTLQVIATEKTTFQAV